MERKKTTPAVVTFYQDGTGYERFYSYIDNLEKSGYMPHRLSAHFHCDDLGIDIIVIMTSETDKQGE